MSPKVNLIVAVDAHFGIGKNNKIPWEIKEDAWFFQDVTKKEYLPKTKNVVIYGKNTWLSFPENNRGLKDRINIIISSTLTNEDLKSQNTSNCTAFINNNLVNTIQDIIANKYGKVGKIFICGGKNIYHDAIKSNLVDEITLTHIHHNYHCDTVLDQSIWSELFKTYFILDSKYTFDLTDKASGDNKVKVSFSKYTSYNSQKCNIEENNYQNMLYSILKTGHYRKTRNEYTYSKFAQTLEFDLSQGFPLLTTKKMFFKGVVEELLWFLKGDTNAIHLSDKGVKIWEPNTSREFLDNMKFHHRQVGDMGPMYGFQWRFFGADYKGMEHNYDGQGFDQVQYCIDLIKKDPYSRRILMSSFNPKQAQEGVLYPCHGISIIFNVEEGDKLSCMMTQRSADSFLGVNW